MMTDDVKLTNEDHDKKIEKEIMGDPKFGEYFFKSQMGFWEGPRVQERREVYISVAERVVLHLLITGAKNLPRFITKLTSDLPEDVEVINVVHSPFDRTFHFFLSHSSFDVVPPGEMCPRFKGEWFFECMPINPLPMLPE